MSKSVKRHNYNIYSSLKDETADCKKKIAYLSLCAYSFTKSNNI